jgi:dihydroneopterin aldolase
MIGTIFIDQAIFYAFIGCKPEEHEQRQVLLVSIEIDVDVSISSKSDEIMDTVCYAELHKQIKTLIDTEKFHIVEHVAEKILNICFSYNQVLQANICIAKPNALDDVKSVGVKMQRKRG